jgi:hypothetical protein
VTTTHLELLDDDDRSENLLLSDLHVGGNVGEDGRLDEVTLGSVTDSALEHGRALVLARLDVRRDAVVLELGSSGTEEGVGAEGVAGLEGLDLRGKLLDELVVDALLNEDAGSGAAALATVEREKG